MGGVRGPRGAPASTPTMESEKLLRGDPPPLFPLPFSPCPRPASLYLSFRALCPTLLPPPRPCLLLPPNTASLKTSMLFDVAMYLKRQTMPSLQGVQGHTAHQACLGGYRDWSFSVASRRWPRPRTTTLTCISRSCPPQGPSPACTRTHSIPFTPVSPLDWPMAGVEPSLRGGVDALAIGPHGE